MDVLRFDLSKQKGFSIKSVTLRTLDGPQEKIAREWAKTHGEASSIDDELCKIAIVAVDDTAVSDPSHFKAFTAPESEGGWNQKTRNFIVQMYRRMNLVDDAMADKLFLDAEAVPVPAGSPKADKKSGT
jgi:hypothetical protein